MKKYDEIKEFIKDNYLVVSDRDIANTFDVSERVVEGLRQRMGLRKSAEQSKALRNKRHEALEVKNPPCFDKFWQG